MILYDLDEVFPVLFLYIGLLYGQHLYPVHEYDVESARFIGSFNVILVIEDIAVCSHVHGLYAFSVEGEFSLRPGCDLC